MKYLSTRDQSLKKSFNEILFEGLSKDGGLFLPVEWPKIDIVNVYSEVKWYFPKTKPGQLLCTPLTNVDAPKCVYFIKEISKQCEVIDYGKIW